MTNKEKIESMEMHLQEQYSLLRKNGESFEKRKEIIGLMSHWTILKNKLVNDTLSPPNLKKEIEDSFSRCEGSLTEAEIIASKVINTP